MSRKKTVGIITTAEESRGGAPSQRTADQYMHAVAAAGAVPLLIPAIAAVQDVAHLVDLLDGVVLTGAGPNVHPSEYGHDETEAHAPFDRDRDRVALALSRACIESGLPIFGICRGMQEMAVAFGATLHPEIRDLPGRMNHRMDREAPRENRFDARHPVSLTPGGTFAGIYGAEEIQVNTLHGQGVIDPGPRVIIEGRAPDGTPEAMLVDGARGFAIGVQWHAEKPLDSPANGPLWRAFGAALG